MHTFSCLASAFLFISVNAATTSSYQGSGLHSKSDCSNQPAVYIVGDLTTLALPQGTPPKCFDLGCINTIAGASLPADLPGMSANCLPANADMKSHVQQQLGNKDYIQAEIYTDASCTKLSAVSGIVLNECIRTSPKTSVKLVSLQNEIQVQNFNGSASCEGKMSFQSINKKDMSGNCTSSSKFDGLTSQSTQFIGETGTTTLAFAKVSQVEPRAKATSAASRSLSGVSPFALLTALCAMMFLL